MPILYSTYSKDWKTVIVPAIRERSGNCCEMCGVRNYSVGYRDLYGNFIPDHGNVVHDLAGEGLSHPSLEPISYSEARMFRDWNNEMDAEEQATRRWIVIVLTVAHLDHDISNNDYSNLSHLCQYDHLNYDQYHHKETRKRNKGILTLF